MVTLREATDNDMVLVMAWRSNPLIYAGFEQQKAPLAYEGHYNWWKSQKNWKQWIIVYGEGKYKRDVGQINLRRLDTDCPEVGYFIGEIPLWNKGIATRSVEEVLEWLEEHSYRKVCAEVKKDNPASAHVLRKMGFVFRNDDILSGLEIFQKEIIAVV